MPRGSSETALASASTSGAHHPRLHAADSTCIAATATATVSLCSILRLNSKTVTLVSLGFTHLLGCANGATLI